MPSAGAGWLDFWIGALLASAALFAAITGIVAVRGGAELIRMFRRRRPGGDS